VVNDEKDDHDGGSAQHQGYRRRQKARDRGPIGFSATHGITLAPPQIHSRLSGMFLRLKSVRRHWFRYFIGGSNFHSASGTTVVSEEPCLTERPGLLARARSQRGK
jgi:hypothetical protein